MNENEIKEIKSYLEDITDDLPEDNNIKKALDYIEKLESELKHYKYSKVPYLEGYIKGLEEGIRKFGYDFRWAPPPPITCDTNNKKVNDYELLEELKEIKYGNKR